MKLKRNRELIVVLMSLVFVLSACVTTGLNVKTPKQQATLWMDVYNAQYTDTMAIMTSPYSTETQKAIGRQKKAILVQVWPLLTAYVGIVDSGGIPSDADTQAIMDLINRLTTMSTGGH